MKIRHFILITFMGLFSALTSCSNDIPPEPSEIYQHDGGTEHLYAGGNCYNGPYKWMYGYWKDDEWITVDNSEAFIDDRSRNDTVQTDSAGNYYIMGIERSWDNLFGVNNYVIKGYWKNGNWTEIKFPDSVEYKVRALRIGPDDTFYYLCVKNGETYGFWKCKQEMYEWFDCHHNDLNATGFLITTPLELDSNGNLYAGGYYTTGTKQNPTYHFFYLKNDMFYPISGDANQKDLRDICIDKSDNLIILGSASPRSSMLGDGTHQVVGEMKRGTSAIWKNGNWEELDSSTYKFIYGYQIEVDKNNEIVILAECSNEYAYGKTGDSKYANCSYFKNGEWTKLQNGYESSSLVYGENLIITENNDVFINGSCKSGVAIFAGYWINGNWHNCSSPYFVDCYSKTFGSCLLNNTMILTGDCWNGIKQAGYWKDGNWEKLSNPYNDQYDSFVTDMAINPDNELYIAGICFDGSYYRYGYWKNNEWTTTFESKGEVSPSVSDYNKYYRITYDKKNNCMAFAKNTINGAEVIINHEYTFPRFYDYKNNTVGIYGFEVDNDGNFYLGAASDALSLAGYWKNYSWIKNDEITSCAVADFVFKDSDVYMLQGNRYWKNDQYVEFGEDDYLFHIDFDSKGNTIFSGYFGNDWVLGYKIGETSEDYIACETLERCYGSYSDCVIDSEDNIIISGIMEGLNIKTLPGIWTNGKWAALENPYDSYYGEVTCLQLIKHK